MTSLGSRSKKTETGFVDIVSSYSKDNCSAAYSLKSLTLDYTGPLVNVRRASDSATGDFYGDSSGKLGLEYISGQSLTDWLGGSNGYVVTWYDQSGNSRNATAGAEANQPLITELDGVTFSTATNTYLAPSNVPLTAGLDTYTYAVDFTPTSLHTGIVVEQNFTSGSGSRRAAILTLDDQRMGFQGFSNNTYALVYKDNVPVKIVMMVNDNLNPGNIVWMYNGSLYTSTTTNVGGMNVATNFFYIGRRSYADAERFDGSIREVIVFNNTLSIPEASLYFTPKTLTFARDSFH